MADDGVSVHQKIGFAEMISACKAEAHRIETAQKALVEAGLRTEPAPTELHRARVFDATALMLERIEPYLDELRQIVRRKQFQARRFGG